MCPTAQKVSLSEIRLLREGDLLGRLILKLTSSSMTQDLLPYKGRLRPLKIVLAVQVNPIGTRNHR